MRRSILVTGGAGYIGSHTVVELAEAGFDTVLVDNFCNSDPQSIERIEKIIGKSLIFEQVDCCDRESYEKVFAKYKFDGVIHFAGLKAVGESVQMPLAYYRNNLVSTINTLELMLQYGVKSIIFSSSATVYGQPDLLPATELTPLKKATSPYGITKQMCEDIIADTVAVNSSLNAICLRYFNPIGAHSSALIGELPQGIPNNLVPYITQTAAGVRDSLSIFGNDYDTPDGTALRDYIDVVDLASAHVAAIKRLVESDNNASLEMFNIGTGVPVSVLELVTKFEKANNLTVKYELVQRREGDVEKIWADVTFANDILGWRAKNSLEDTLQNAWRWERYIRGL